MKLNQSIIKSIKIDKISKKRENIIIREKSEKKRKIVNKNSQSLRKPYRNPFRRLIELLETGQPSKQDACLERYEEKLELIYLQTC